MLIQEAAREVDGVHVGSAGRGVAAGLHSSVQMCAK